MRRFLAALLVVLVIAAWLLAIGMRDYLYLMLGMLPP